MRCTLNSSATSAAGASASLRLAQPHLVVHMHARGRAAPPGGTPARTPLAVRRRYVRGPVGPSGGALAHGGAALCLVGCSCVWCGRAEVCGDRVRAVVYWAINSYLPYVSSNKSTPLVFFFCECSYSSFF